VLVKHRRKYFLQFAFEKEVQLTERKVEQLRICAVDLGINTEAVCSIMTAGGTVVARRFINFPAEKDHLWHVLKRIRKHQQLHGPGSVKGFWAYAGRLNEEIAGKTAAGILAYAKENRADVIVFEHLDMKGRKIRGKNRQKLHMWKKQAVQKITEHHAHLCGIRISRVCAWKTSALAYDGSGPLVRDEKNHSLAVFANGKQYNCDLSASYNIGARYFIRELLKAVPETERSALAAKVPAVQRRTSCTYADLLALRREMAGAA
jgi:IS605 OrfB family transposase